MTVKELNYDPYSSREYRREDSSMISGQCTNYFSDYRIDFTRDLFLLNKYIYMFSFLKYPHFRTSIRLKAPLGKALAEIPLGCHKEMGTSGDGNS